MDGDRGVGVRGLDEAEDPAVFLVYPVLPVVHAVPALRFEVGAMGSGGLLGRYRAVHRVNVHKQRHCLSFPGRGGRSMFMTRSVLWGVRHLTMTAAPAHLTA